MESQVERDIEAARAALLEHMGELGRRFKAARGKLDVPAKVVAHPLAAVGAAFALGALFGRRGRRRAARGEEDKSGIGGMAIAGLGALALRLMRDMALREASGAALRWWDRRDSEDRQENDTPQPW